MSRAKDCRDHAAECERTAEFVIDPETKRSYLDLAKTWRELADKLDKIDRLDKDN